MQTVNNNRKQ